VRQNFESLEPFDNKQFAVKVLIPPSPRNLTIKIKMVLCMLFKKSNQHNIEINTIIVATVSQQL